MLYTRAGDSGTTRTFGCDQRISKSSQVAEALGTLDEVNSFLGLVKVKSQDGGFDLEGKKFGDMIDDCQNTLFIVQAEVAGAKKTVTDDKVKDIEMIIDSIEKSLPPIKTFFISGGTELVAMFDFARTLARRAERRVVGVHDEGLVKVGEFTLAYLNRLSSLLYALARLTSHKSGIKEEAPRY